MTELSYFAEVAALDTGLSIVTTLRADGTMQACLVNAGVLNHPVTGVPVVGFVGLGSALKLRHLRERPRVTVAVRGGWKYAVVEGAAELIGPLDPHPQLDAEGLRMLLRDIFVAAGGTHDDWGRYDRVMREEARTAVLVAADRAYPKAAHPDAE